MWKLESDKFPSPMNYSFVKISPWELEQNPAALQEPLAGLVWPPRSYTCTFCRREFRSAQALGGHMNVHRRDRARLKQSSPPHRKHTSDPYQEPLTFSAQENAFDRLQLPPTISFTPSMNYRETAAQDENRRKSGKAGLVRDDERDGDEGFTGSRLSVGLDLVDRGNVICKRHKKSSTTTSSSSSSSLPFFRSNLCSGDRYRSATSSMEDIDLELRLGDSPAVK